MSSDEFNELLKSLNKPILQTDDISENLYVWKPVPIVSSPFKDTSETLSISIPPPPPPPQPVSMVQTVQTVPIPPVISQPVESIVTIPSTYVKPPDSVISYNPPSTVYYPYVQPPPYMPPPPRYPEGEPYEYEKKERNMWFEWSLYIFGFSLILFIVFFALWYFYVKDYNKTYNLELQQQQERDPAVFPPPKPREFKIPPPSFLKPQILEEPFHFESDTNKYEAEKLIEEEEEYFKPETLMETIFEEQKEKEKEIKKKKSYFDLSDVDESEFEVKSPRHVTNDTKLSDESDEVKRYAEKRAKLFES